jgi:hypothetical protein
VGGEDGEARVLERDEAHEHVAVLALAADLVGVDARGLVAVVAVGDQQLGLGERVDRGGDGAAVPDAPDAVLGAVIVQDLAPRHGLSVGREGAPRRSRRVVVEAEDRRQVGARGAREAEAVLLRPGVRALVGADAAGAVVLDPDAGEEALAGVAVAVRPGVVLGERPQGRLRIPDQDLLALPVAEQLGGVGVGVEVAVGFGQVDFHDVVRRAGGQTGAQLGVDHVVGRRHDGLQAADAVERVVEGVEGLDVCHGAAEANNASARS